MDQSRYTPLLGPDVQDIPPAVLRERLRVDETLVWWSRGCGSTFDRGSWLIVASLVALLLLLLSVPGATRLVVELLPIALILVVVLVVLRGITGARNEVYGLTGGRLLFLFGPPVPICLDLRRDGGSAGAPSMLEVTGTRERGTLRLQSAVGLHSYWRLRPVRLTGIDRPIEVANLIKATLDLPIEVEDRTR